MGTPRMTRTTDGHNGGHKAATPSGRLPEWQREVWAACLAWRQLHYRDERRSQVFGPPVPTPGAQRIAAAFERVRSELLNALPCETGDPEIPGAVILATDPDSGRPVTVRGFLAALDHAATLVTQRRRPRLRRGRPTCQEDGELFARLYRIRSLYAAATPAVRVTPLALADYILPRRGQGAPCPLTKDEVEYLCPAHITRAGQTPRPLRTRLLERLRRGRPQ